MIGNRRIKITVQVMLCLLLVWWIAVYVITKSYYMSRAETLVKIKTSLSQTHATDLADHLQRNLLYLAGTPDLLTHTIRFDKELAAFGTNSVPSRLSYEERKRRWTSAPALNRLSQLLAVAKNDIDVDLIYVLDAAGDSIAASNWDSAGSPIGSNY